MTQSLGKIYPGQRVRTLHGETDTDHHGDERLTAAGSWGHVASHNHEDHWNVSFPNGAYVVLTDAEMLNPTLYSRARPGTLEQRALALHHGQFVRELTMFDDELYGFTEEVAGNPEEIIQLVAESRRNEDAMDDMLDVIGRALKTLGGIASLADPKLRHDMERILADANRRSTANTGLLSEADAAA